MKKQMIVLGVVAMIILAGCSTQTNKVEPTPVVDPTAMPTEDTTVMEDNNMDNMMTFTMEELAKYNGKDGQPAYIAFDGVVYDASANPQWTSGEHGGQMAGTDITDVFPHGDERYKELPVVGKLVK